MSTPLASFRDTKQVNSLVRSRVALGASKVVYAGGVVVTDTATGYGCAGKTATGLVARGIAQQTVDNSSGAAGAAAADVDNRPAWLDILGTDLVTQANVDQTVYLVDDHTIAATDGGGTRSIAGILREVGTLGALVEFDTVAGSVVASLAASVGALPAITVTDGSASGIEEAYTMAIPDAATASYTITCASKFEVTSAQFNKNGSAGGASDTIQLLKGATPITDAMSLNVAAKTKVTNATLDPAQSSIAAAGAITVTVTKASAANVGGQLIVKGYKRS